MRTPEEVGLGYLDVVEEMQVRPRSQEVLDRFLALIRARDAEVRADERAKVLAEVWKRNTTAVPSRAFVSPYDAEP